MTPSAVAFNTDPNAAVIGIRHDIVSRKLLVLLVPDMPAPESIIQLTEWLSALSIATGAMDIDILSLCVTYCEDNSDSTAGPGSVKINSLFWFSVILKNYFVLFPTTKLHMPFFQLKILFCPTTLFFVQGYFENYWGSSIFYFGTWNTLLDFSLLFFLLVLPTASDVLSLGVHHYASHLFQMNYYSLCLSSL